MIDKENIKACVDWFRCIVPVSDVKPFVKELEHIDYRLALDNFLCDGRSKLNYRNCWRHNEVPSLSFSFNPAEDSLSCLTCSDSNANYGILFELSGDAIRYLGDKSLKLILRYLHSLDSKCTRIDYALDFFDKDNEIVPLMLQGCRNFVNPKAKDITVSGKIKRCPSNWKMYVNAYPKEEETVNFTLCNHGSDHGMFRIYDKRYECLYGRNKAIGEQLLNGHNYWYRSELELHNGKDVPWANDSFNQFVLCNFNIFAIIGHTFDSWFSFKIRRFNSNTFYDDVDLWDSFVSELISTIHFVELVHQKFVQRDSEYYWRQIQHNSVWLSLLLDISVSDPDKWNNIIKAARVRRFSESQFIMRYGAVDSQRRCFYE